MVSMKETKTQYRGYIMTSKPILYIVIPCYNEEKVLPLEKNEKVAFIGGFVKNPRYQGGGSSHVNSFKVTSVWDALTEKENVIYAE